MMSLGECVVSGVLSLRCYETAWHGADNAESEQQQQQWANIIAGALVRHRLTTTTPPCQCVMRTAGRLITIPASDKQGVRVASHEAIRQLARPVA